MCELLFRVVDKAPGQIGASLAGDVIVVCPDGHPWSAAEQANPDWRIVKLPGLDAALMYDYAVAQMDIAGRLLFKRAIGVDMTTTVGDWLAVAPQVSTLSPEAVLEIVAVTVAREEGAVV